MMQIILGGIRSLQDGEPEAKLSRARGMIRDIAAGSADASRLRVNALNERSGPTRPGLG